MNCEKFNINTNSPQGIQLFSTHFGQPFVTSPSYELHPSLQTFHQIFLQNNQLIIFFKTNEIPQGFHFKDQRHSLPERLNISYDFPNATNSHLNLLPTQNIGHSESELQAEFERMLNFILYHMGKNNEVIIENARNHYLQSPLLLQIYDKLYMKYYSSKKSKEDMIRYIFRKVLKGLLSSIMKEENLSRAKASVVIYQKYFQTIDEHSRENNGDTDEIYDFFMSPLGSHKYKNINLKLVTKIFSSPNFYRAYENYLPELERILIKENEKRKKKLLGILANCVQKKCISELGSMMRLPWLDVWINDTKNIAVGLMPNKRLIHVCKKPKC